MIPDTINEFPSFSFLLGDLHAHVLALPFTVLALAFALQVALHGPRGDLLWRAVAEALAAGLAVGDAVRDQLVVVPRRGGRPGGGGDHLDPRGGGPRAATRWSWLGLVLVASFVLILPFVLNFDPEARGIGFVHVRRPFGKWLGDMALIYGILLWPLLAALASRLREAQHTLALDRLGRSRPASWSARCWPPTTSPARCSSPSGWRPASAPRSRRRLSAPARFLWILIAGGAALLLIPELLYLRDAFDGSALFRMNTVFKAGYQAFLLLGLAAGCALPWAGVWLPRRAWTPWAAVAAVLLLLGLVYPYAGSYARTGGFANAPSLDGLKWLSAALARRPGRDRLAARQHAPATPSCSRPSATTTRRSATRASRPSPAARR